jgi:hypothetical protein
VALQEKWPYKRSGLTREVALQVGWPYKRSGLTRGVALQEKWPYKRSDLTRGVALQEITNTILFISILKVAVLVVIVWEVDLQQPVQSVPITIKVVSSNPVHGEVHSIQHFGNPSKTTALKI